MTNKLFILFIFFFLIACNQSNHDELIGDYSYTPNGQAVYRVTKKNGVYFIQKPADFRKKSWQPKDTLQDIKDNKKLNNLIEFCNWPDFIISGLTTNRTFILKVKKGSKVGLNPKDDTITTDYVFIVIEQGYVLGGGLYKKPHTK